MTLSGKASIPLKRGSGRRAWIILLFIGTSDAAGQEFDDVEVGGPAQRRIMPRQHGVAANVDGVDVPDIQFDQPIRQECPFRLLERVEQPHFG